MNTVNTLTKRIVIALVALVLACTAAVALSGCQSKEQQAESALKAQLDEYKNGSANILGSEEASDVAELGVNAEQFLSELREGFSYEIKSSKEGADAGTIEIETSITSKQLTGAVKNSLPTIMGYALGAALSNPSEGEIQQYVSTVIVEQLQKEEPVTTTITIPMKEESGEWKITEQGTQALSNAIVGDFEALQAELSSGSSSSL